MKTLLTSAALLVLLCACQGRPAPPLEANSTSPQSVVTEVAAASTSSQEGGTSSASTSSQGEGISSASTSSQGEGTGSASTSSQGEDGNSSEATSSQGAAGGTLVVSEVLAGKTLLTGTLTPSDTTDAAKALAAGGVLSETQTLLGYTPDGKLNVHLAVFRYFNQQDAAAQNQAFLDEGTSASLSDTVVTAMYKQSPFVDMTMEQAQSELTKNGYVCDVKPAS